MIAVQSGRFAVLGDVQRTSRLEFWRESNPEETARIVAEIARRAPDFVVGLGDLVFHGSSRRDWARLDALLAPLSGAGIPIFPVLGNHEYWLRRGTALRNFYERFPELEARHWRAESYGRLGLVFLDSNEAPLGPTAWEEQKAWFTEEMARLDADPAVRGVLVFVHHPPFTNSTVSPDAVQVQRAFIPAFVRSSKSLAMISGHVHSFERFVRGGKTFVVAGGGGGPRVKLARGAARRHLDDAFEHPGLRPFHFLDCGFAATGLEIAIVGLEKSATACAPLGSFTLAFEAVPQAAVRA